MTKLPYRTFKWVLDDVIDVDKLAKNCERSYRDAATSGGRIERIRYKLTPPIDVDIQQQNENNKSQITLIHNGGFNQGFTHIPDDVDISPDKILSIIYSEISKEEINTLLSKL